MTKKPETQPDDAEGVIKATEPDADVEGHQFLPNDALARSAASSRERDIQRNLQKQELKSESRRPFFRKKS